MYMHMRMYMYIHIHMVTHMNYRPSFCIISTVSNQLFREGPDIVSLKEYQSQPTFQQNVPDNSFRFDVRTPRQNYRKTPHECALFRLIKPMWWWRCKDACVCVCGHLFTKDSVSKHRESQLSLHDSRRYIT